MSSFNSVTLMGNLVRDPTLKFLPSQTAVCEFGIALNRKYRTSGGEDREEVCFVDVSAFGKTGETIEKFFTKGKPILINGRLKYDSWEDKNGGGKRSKLTVIADSFCFVGGKDDRQQDDATEREHYAAGGAVPGSDGPPRGQAKENKAFRQQSLGNMRPDLKTVPAGAPFSDEQHFEKDDIPF